MKLVFISDSHLRHVDNLNFPIIPFCDILIHAGDQTWMGTEEEVSLFGKWLYEQSARIKIIIPGNHDWLAERNPGLYREILQVKNTHILIDEAIEIEGIKFYGSPYSPKFGNWAFATYPGEHAEQKWASIPDDTDILITHGPPLGIGDLVLRNENTGCQELRKRVYDIKPKIHVFGHIHEAYGAYNARGSKMVKPSILPGKTLFLNASLCDLAYEPINKPFEVIYGE